MTGKEDTNHGREEEISRAVQEEEQPKAIEDPEENTGSMEEQAGVSGESEAAEKEQQLTELTNRLLRLQADFDNFRRRTRQEKEEFFKYANQDLISSLLPVLDNFQRAIAANVNQEDPFVAGVNMIFKLVMEVLAKEGLEQIESVGCVFDPHLHEAVMSVGSEEHGPNIIIEEFQKGYKLKERVIRPSMVKVANAQ